MKKASFLYMLMLQTFLESFSFIPLMAPEENIFEYFCKFNVSSVAMATNQNQQFEQNSYVK